MDKLKLASFKEQEVNIEWGHRIKGGMSCHDLADQLDWMWDQGGQQAQQADAIMYLIADGYDLCEQQGGQQ